MTREEIHAILSQVTEEILERMRNTGFVYLDEVRYDPIPWDISDGHCQAWAFRAAELLPGGFAAWIDPQHCVLVYNGLFYDADWLDGTNHWNQLPMFSEPPVRRPEP